MFSDRYKQLIASGVTDPAGEKLIRRVENALSADADTPSLPGNGLNQYLDNDLDSDLDIDSPTEPSEDETIRNQTEEISQLRSQLDDMAAKAGEWYEKAKALEVELEQLRSQPVAPVTDPEVIDLLRGALKLEANSGGKIKIEIDKALERLGVPSPPRKLKKSRSS